MKTFLLPLVLLAMMPPLFSQSTIPPGMVYVPHTMLNYDYWKNKNRKIHVSDFYAAQYVESNFQYRQYLQFLETNGKEEQLRAAQPNASIWDAANLETSDREYLKENYWTNQEFSDYPVLGLDWCQINSYLIWKTDRLNLASLMEAGTPITTELKDGNFSTKSFKKSLPEDHGPVRLFPGIRLTTFMEQMACLPTAGKRKYVKVKTNKKFLSWLQTQKQFSFLVYEPSKEQKRHTAIHEKLEGLGIRPVRESDINAKQKWNYVKNLPLIVLEQRWPDSLYKEGFIVMNPHEDLAELEKDSTFNPKKLRVERFNPDKSTTVSWVAWKGHLKSIAVNTADATPFFTFRACMTKPDE